MSSQLLLAELRLHARPVPGKTNHITLTVDRAGTYDGACTQYCGVQHAWMRLRVFAQSRDQFDAWVARARASRSSGAPGQASFYRTPA
jgi:cytochrome c oxidase subunit 2